MYIQISAISVASLWMEGLVDLMYTNQIRFQKYAKEE